MQAIETTGEQRVLRCAGQTSVDENGQPLHEGDMSAQVGQALDNLETVLAEAGYSLADVVRLNYYVTDTEAFLASGEVWGARLADGRLPCGWHALAGERPGLPGLAGGDRGNGGEVGDRAAVMPAREMGAGGFEPPTSRV